MDARHLTWSEAIAWTHQSPAGFSRRHRAEEHFSTSIGVGDHVARVVLERCRAAAGRHGISSPWIVDVGAGDGLLLRQLLKLGFPAEQLVGVDVRPAPVDLPVRWIQGVAPACVPRFAGLLFAHEFLDDVPAEYVVDGRLQPDDFTIDPEYGCRLTTEARRSYLALLSERFDSPIKAIGDTEAKTLPYHLYAQSQAIVAWVRGNAEQFKAWRQR